MRTAVLRTIIPGVSAGGDEDRAPSRAIEAETGRSRRSVTGEPDVLHGLLTYVPNHRDRPVGCRGCPWLRGDLPDGAKGVRHDIEPPVVHHQLNGGPRSRPGLRAFRLQDGRQIDSADQGRTLREHHRPVLLERERDPQGMLLERQRRPDGLGRARGAGRPQKEKQRYPQHASPATHGSNPHAPNRSSGTPANPRRHVKPGRRPGGVARGDAHESNLGNCGIVASGGGLVTNS